MAYNKWNIRTQNQGQVNSLSASLGCGEIVARMLINRGFTDAKTAKEFLSPSPDIVHDPFLIPDMDKAVERICLAIVNKEKICIYGDYDVDGITSVSALYLYLKNFTDGIDYYIPDRFSQGYGVNENALKMISGWGCDLLITVDTGVSAIKELQYAKTLGIDSIVTDHHECQSEIPDVVAVVNPMRRDSEYPFSKLAGVGVVYKLICALDQRMETSYADNYLDLMTIGTIADIMPLVDENRYIVKAGLEKIAKSPNAGLKSLLNYCIPGQEITSLSIGYTIAPRINAAGRMENAETAVKLFITDDINEADDIANRLCELNIERQRIENEIFVQAVNMIETEELDRKYNALVLWNREWHSGVIGIVASKLKDKYNMPVVLFSVDELAKGSGRSIIPFNLYEAFESISDMLVQYGGHKYAAGVLVENDRLDEFRRRLSDCVGNFRQSNELTQMLDIECEISQAAISLETTDDIMLLRPYGKSNEIPLFCVRNVRICEIFPTSNNRHLRIKLVIGDKTVTSFYYGKTQQTLDYRENDLVDIVCEVNENDYRNIKSVQLIIRDMRYSENYLLAVHTKRKMCDCPETVLPQMLPSRSDIAGVYRFLYHAYLGGIRRFNIDTLANVINKDSLVSLNYEKMYFSVKILLELEIVSGTFMDNVLCLTGVETDRKFSLTDSSLLIRIYEKAGVEFGN